MATVTLTIMGKRNQYTNAEKLALARKGSLPGCSIASVAHGEGLPQSTMQGFIIYKKYKETGRKFYG
jgi:transposase-like protein